MKNLFRKMIGLGALLLLLFSAEITHAAPAKMHVMEGFLSPTWAIFWWVVALPFWWIGLQHVRTLLSEKPEQRLYLGLAGGFIFVLSALKIPSVTGSSSHPTGTGMGVMMFGPYVTAILGTIALIFQALLVAHGGITTLGANAFSMAIGGPLVAYYLIWKPLQNTPLYVRVFLTAFVADLATYLITTTQLSLAFPDPTSGFVGSWLTFAGIFAITQIPLAIGEGILTVLIYNALLSSGGEEVAQLGVGD